MISVTRCAPTVARILYVDVADATVVWGIGKKFEGADVR
jgi:hypothetical protein